MAAGKQEHPRPVVPAKTYSRGYPSSDNSVGKTSVSNKSSKSTEATLSSDLSAASDSSAGQRRKRVDQPPSVRPAKKRKRVHEEKSIVLIAGYGPSVELYGEVFTTFRRSAMMRTPRMSRTLADKSWSILATMRKCYTEESEREDDLRAIFEPWLREKLSPALNSALHYRNGQYILRLDADVEVLVGVLSVEASYPYISPVLRYRDRRHLYREFWTGHTSGLARQSNLPCFYIRVKEYEVVAFGAVSLDDRMVTQRLCYAVSLFEDGRGLDTLISSLADAFATLRDHYLNLSVTGKVDPARTFPRFTSWPATTARPAGRFSYAKRLGDSGGPRCCTFSAQSSDGTPLVVKFARTYNVEAHQLLAAEGLAPKILYNGICDAMEMTMVVMDFVPGSTLSDMTNGAMVDKRAFKSVFTDIRRALSILHDNQLVFGDLRMLNIMVHTGDKAVDNAGSPHRLPTSCAMIIDFDWCGKHGKASYPDLLNMDGGIDWHPGVRPGGSMLMVHDKYRFLRLREEFRNDLTLHVKASATRCSAGDVKK